MKISIVIPNYNGLVLLRKNLQRNLQILSESQNHLFEIYIIDDDSNDESFVWLKNSTKILEFSKNISIIVQKNIQNSGFSTTANRGVFQAKGELTILLNTDVYLKKGLIEKAISYFNNPKVFGIGFLDESIEGKSIVNRGRGIAWWEKGFYIHKKGEVDHNDTAWISGGSCMFRTEIFKKLGGFNEIFNPFYWEDIDLSYRAIKSGYLIFFARNCSVVHKHDLGAIKSNYSKSKIRKIAYRNQFIFIWRNASAKQLFVHILYLPYHFFQAFKHHDYMFILGFFTALYRFIIFYFSKK